MRPSRGSATARRRGAWAWPSPFLHCPQPSASSPESQSPERALRRLSVGVPSWRHRAPGVPLEVPARNRQAWLPRSLSPLCWTYSPPDVTQRSSASGGNEARAPWSTSGAAAPSADRCPGRRKHGRRNASPPESEILKNNRWHLLRLRECCWGIRGSSLDRGRGEMGPRPPGHWGEESDLVGKRV